MIWTPPKTWEKIDSINVPDWQRIDDNTRWIAEFYGVTLPYKTWAHTDFPTPMEMARIQSNIEALIKYFQGVYTGSRIEISQKFSGEMQSLTVTGKTVETGTGDKSPDNPYTIKGTSKLEIWEGKENRNLTISPNQKMSWYTYRGTVDIAFVADSTTKSGYRYDLTITSLGDNNSVHMYFSPKYSGAFIKAGGIQYTFSCKIKSSVERIITVKNEAAGNVGKTITVTPKYQTVVLTGKNTIPYTAFYVFDDCKNLQIGDVISFCDLKTELGDIATPWSPAPEDTENYQTIPLPQPLYSLPDGTADSYETVSGTGTQKIGVKTVTSSNDTYGPWQTAANILSTGMAGFTLKIKTNNGSLVCDRLKPYPAETNLVNAKKEGIYLGMGDKLCRIVIAASRLGTITGDMAASQLSTLFGAWAAAHPVTVLYELATPQAISGTAQTIPTYYPYTQITNDAGAEITAVMKGDNHNFQSKFDWNLLNDIESLLLEMHAKVVELQLSVRRSGTFVSGQDAYIPLGGT